jgi:hypothetical protein
VAPNPFEGTWHGTFDAYHDNASQVELIVSVTLIMSENTWLCRFENNYEGECSGTYTRDNDSGRYATLLVKDRKGFFASNASSEPTAAQILSSNELKLTSRQFPYSQDRMITITK